MQRVNEKPYAFQVVSHVLPGGVGFPEGVGAAVCVDDMLEQIGDAEQTVGRHFLSSLRWWWWSSLLLWWWWWCRCRCTCDHAVVVAIDIFGIVVVPVVVFVVAAVCSDIRIFRVFPRCVVWLRPLCCFRSAEDLKERDSARNEVAKHGVADVVNEACESVDDGRSHAEERKRRM